MMLKRLMLRTIMGPERRGRTQCERLERTMPKPTMVRPTVKMIRPDPLGFIFKG
jgi:hypothetical protein